MRKYAIDHPLISVARRQQQRRVKHPLRISTNLICCDS